MAAEAKATPRTSRRKTHADSTPQPLGCRMQRRGAVSFEARSISPDVGGVCGARHVVEHRPVRVL